MTKTIDALVEALEAEKAMRLYGQSPECGKEHWESIRERRRAVYEATDAALAQARAEQAEPVAFDGYLCRAWGETELPCAEVVADLSGVRAFMVREWLGPDDDPTLTEVMAEIESHDWKDEGEWSANFEIGGVSVERVYSFATPPAAPVASAEQAEPFGTVTVVKREGCADMHWFYRWPEPPYLDNAAEVHAVFTSPPVAPVAKLEPLSEDELRAGFENWFSNQGAWPAAIERNTNGPYLLAVTQSAWVAWFNAGPAVTAAHNAKLAPSSPATKREHITDGTPCWCEPELSHKDPDTGAEVWVHRGFQ